MNSIPEEISELSILLTSDEKVQKLNSEYRGKDKPTDVLSFSQIEDDLPITGNLLGDIVISLDTAKAQAKQYANTFSQEVLRLTIHGLLHLLGYEHIGVSNSEAQKMRTLEKKLFRQFSVDF